MSGPENRWRERLDARARRRRARRQIDPMEWFRRHAEKQAQLTGHPFGQVSLDPMEQQRALQAEFLARQRNVPLRMMGLAGALGLFR